MRIGDLVTHAGRPCYVRGFDPMSLPDKRVHLEDAETGAEFKVPLSADSDLVETLISRLDRTAEAPG